MNADLTHSNGGDTFPPLLGEGQGGVGYTASKPRVYTRETLRRSRDLRKNLTDAEKKLWQLLRNRQMEGYKFRRQFFIGQYIVDFICVERKLVIEVDGGQHNQSAYDKRRNNAIKAQGYHILRFWNNDALQNREGVLNHIRQFLLEQTPPQPSPKRGGSTESI